jgi:transcriptional antiterminator RfaH
MMRWYVVYTKQGQERLAEGNLRNQGFETYLPRLATRRKQRRGVSIAVTVPMFSRYLFVRLNVEEGPWRAVNGTYGVVSLVSFGDRPAPLSDAVIDELKNRESDDGVVHLAKIDPFRPGDAVALADGPMSDLRGLCAARTDGERVVVLMSLLGRQVPVRVAQDRLRRAS